MLKSFKIALAGLCAAASFAIVPAQATPLHNLTGLGGSFTVETFDTNFGQQSAAGTQFAGMTWSGDMKVRDEYNGLYPNLVNSVLANFFPCCTNLQSVTFSSVMSDVAFAFVTNPGTTTFSAYLGNTLVEQFNAVTDLGPNAGNFYGFTGSAFDRIVFDTGNTSNNAFLIDQMQMRAGNAVPEPGSLALLAMGLLGVGALRRGKRA